MLKYIVVLIDDSSVPYCHCDNPKGKSRLIPLDTLKDAVRYAMMENLSVQFVWPDYEIPEAYKKVIGSVDHVNIVPATLTESADIVVYHGIPEHVAVGAVVVLRLSFEELIGGYHDLVPLLDVASRINIVFKDVWHFSEPDFESYSAVLDEIAGHIRNKYVSGHQIQFNLLTDRIMLDGMNNCNAGSESVTLAPDGGFYVCPAFYYSGDNPVGTLDTGLELKNQKLYCLDHSPVCRGCDAWHCRRCIWLNKRQTLEVNTPGHEQCVMAHIEREASRRLLASIREIGEFLPGKEIEKLDYIDPFYNMKR